jgi:hypothetical protein
MMAVFVFGFLPSAFAKIEPRKIRVDFQYSTNLKFERHQSLEITGSEVYINGIKVPASDVLRMQSPMLTVLRGPKDQVKGSCYAGTFIYKIQKGAAKAKLQTGCISSNSFNELNAAFVAMTN